MCGAPGRLIPFVGPCFPQGAGDRELRVLLYIMAVCLNAQGLLSLL